MLSFIQNLLQNQGPMIASTVAVIYGLNAVLTGIKKGLERIKDKTESQVDNKLYEMLNKLSGMLATILEFLTANSSVLPKEAKEELEKKDQ